MIGDLGSKTLRSLLPVSRAAVGRAGAGRLWPGRGTDRELSAVAKSVSEESEEEGESSVGVSLVIQDLTVERVFGGSNASPIAASDQPALASSAARRERAAPDSSLRYTHSSSGSLSVFSIAS